MKTTGNTILVTGGGSGIGQGLAEAFQKLGNQVIIAGRDEGKLAKVTTANPGMKALTVDMTKAESIRGFAERAVKEFPALNVVINNAGIMKAEDYSQDPAGTLDDAEAIVVTNLLGPIRLTAHLLPYLRKQSNAAIVNVTSGLAFVPFAMTPTYSGTKAAMHSVTQSLRYQLKGSQVQVIELPPPYVQTHLMGQHQAEDPRAMPLDQFIAEVMEILAKAPEETEICVENVLPLRNAAEGGRKKHEAFVTEFNDTMLAGFQD